MGLGWPTRGEGNPMDLGGLRRPQWVWVGQEGDEGNPMDLGGGREGGEGNPKVFGGSSKTPMGLGWSRGG